MRNLKDFGSWNGIRNFILTKDGQNVHLLTDFNPTYGDIITRFQIGDIPLCGEEAKYYENKK